jgi:hypothetical protein
MVVVLDGRRNSGVVIVPLGFGDLAVIVFVSEVGKELKEGLILCDLSRDHLWVSVAGIDASEVGGGNTSRSITVELAESGIDNGLSGGVEAASDHDKELIEVDIAILISVVMRQKAISLLLGKFASALIEANEELLSINLSVSVIIHSSENSSQPSHGLGSSGAHLSSNFVYD